MFDPARCAYHTDGRHNDLSEERLSRSEQGLKKLKNSKYYDKNSKTPSLPYTVLLYSFRRPINITAVECVLEGVKDFLNTNVTQ